MGKRTHSQILAVLLYLVLVAVAFPITANADMGPKPSVRIRFENMGDALCYGTLLSERESTGPASVWDGTEEHARIRRGRQASVVWGLPPCSFFTTSGHVGVHPVK